MLWRTTAATLALVLASCSDREGPPRRTPTSTPTRGAQAAGSATAPRAPVIFNRLDCAEVATEDLIPTWFPGSRRQFDRSRDEYGTETDCYYTMGKIFGHVRINCQNTPWSDEDVRATIKSFIEATPVEGIGRGADQFDQRMIRFWHRVVPKCTIEVQISPDSPKLRDFAREIDARITALGNGSR
jgi:hypothetical protein